MAGKDLGVEGSRRQKKSYDRSSTVQAFNKVGDNETKNSLKQRAGERENGRGGQ